MNKNNEYISHFNQKSEQYLLCRPDYPDALFDFLAEHVANNALVWDCGTGTGQAAKALAQRFRKIIATDINEQQLAEAPKMANIEYYQCPAEQTPIEAGSIELITIAQALHWFDFPKFYKEVSRVSAPNAQIAAWCYSLGYFNEPIIDELIKTLYSDILGHQYWPKERFYIDEHYKTIPFPFEKQEIPNFFIQKSFNLSQLIGYLSTWSAIKEYQKQKQLNPLELILPELQVAWGHEKTLRTINWSVHCLWGRVHR